MPKAVWKGAIGFGLLNIPVELVSLADSQNPRFHLVDRRDFSRIGYRPYNKRTGREIARKLVAKAYLYAPGKAVLFEERDFMRVNPELTKMIPIQNFVRKADLDLLMFGKPYILVPTKAGQRAYAILQKVLFETHTAAMASIVLRYRQRLVAVFPKDDYLVLETLRFPQEVESLDLGRFLDRLSLESIQLTVGELKAARALVNEMTIEWHPESYRDNYRDELMQFIEQKVKFGDAMPEPPPTELATSSFNSMEPLPALMRSLALKQTHQNK